MFVGISGQFGDVPDETSFKLSFHHLRSVECEKIHDICQAVYGMKHLSDELEGLYLAREDEQICLLYYQVFVGMLEININSAEVLYKQKEETINE